MRLLIDMNLTPRWVQSLSAAGYECVAHTAEAKPSVILLRGEPLTPEPRLSALLAGIADCSGELEGGAILTIDWSDRPRARVLPLK